jgi:acetyl-CoA C-acetyltransferase
MLADQPIKCGDADVVIAWGMEKECQMLHICFLRHVLPIGYMIMEADWFNDQGWFWEVYNDFHMGSCAEICARDFKFTREQVDEYAIQSYKKR